MSVCGTKPPDLFALTRFAVSTVAGRLLSREDPQYYSTAGLLSEVTLDPECTIKL
ncbi:uncharacterized protein LOC144868730 isoform X2 [Branchiostoma floridae x Branchiostoma japonicum]